MAARSLSLLLPSSNLFSASDARRIVGRRPASLSPLASSRWGGLSSSLLFGAPLLRSTTQMPLNQRRGPSAMVAANSTPPTAESDSVPTGETPKQSDILPADETSKQSVSVPAEKKTPKMSARMIKSIALAEMEARKLRYSTTGTEALLMGILYQAMRNFIPFRVDSKKLQLKPEHWFFIMNTKRFRFTRNEGRQSYNIYKPWVEVSVLEMEPIIERAPVATTVDMNNIVRTSVAANFLRAHGITLLKVREETGNILGKGDRTYISPVDIPLTEKAQRVIDQAIEEKMKSGILCVK
ncbi:hypothetical protein ACLOJK_005345 [Asimina triloba]